MHQSYQTDFEEMAPFMVLQVYSEIVGSEEWAMDVFWGGSVLDYGWGGRTHRFLAMTMGTWLGWWGKALVPLGVGFQSYSLPGYKTQWLWCRSWMTQLLSSYFVDSQLATHLAPWLWTLWTVGKWKSWLQINTKSWEANSVYTHTHTTLANYRNLK